MTPIRCVSSHTGICKWFSVEKGYGFVTPNDGSPDVFVHQTNIYAEGFRSLAEGEQVEYECVVDDQSGKTKAHNVTGPGGSYVQGAPRGYNNGDGGFGGGGGGNDGGFGGGFN